MDKINKYILCLSIFGAVGVLSGCENRHDKKKTPYPINSPWVSVSSGIDTPSGRTSNSIVFTGNEVIIWGGVGESFNRTNTGGVYNIQNNSWMKTPTGGNCPSPRSGHSCIWTGDRMIIWGGECMSEFFNDGAVYDPFVNTWGLSLPLDNCPSKRCGHSAVWTGEKMIIWGGSSYSASAIYFNNGAIYDPLADAWDVIFSGVGCPSPRTSHSAIWIENDNKMLIWGGSFSGNPVWDGAYYYPATDTWEPINSTILIPYPSYAINSDARVCTGDEIYFWGGTSFGAVLNNGAIYNLMDNTWRLTSQESGCPSGRIYHSSVWTSEKMIIWGGDDEGGSTNTGGIYDPGTDMWEEIRPDYNTPLPRHAHSAIWLGDSMFIWGGVDKDGNHLNTGGIYTPPDP